MKQNRHKSELELAVEKLEAQGINTKGAQFSMVNVQEFDPKTNQFVTVTKLRKIAFDYIVDFVFKKKGGDSND